MPDKASEVPTWRRRRPYPAIDPNDLGHVLGTDTRRPTDSAGDVQLCKSATFAGSAWRARICSAPNLRLRCARLRSPKTLPFRDHRNTSRRKGESPNKRAPNIRVSIESLQRFVPRWIKIDRGNPTSILAVRGREQHETTICPRNAASLLPHQRLEDNDLVLDLAAKCLHRGPPSCPTSTLRLQLNLEQRVEADLTHAEVGVNRVNHRHQIATPVVDVDTGLLAMIRLKLDARTCPTDRSLICGCSWSPANSCAKGQSHPCPTDHLCRSSRTPTSRYIRSILDLTVRHGSLK
jgi:hypothetical protein